MSLKKREIIHQLSYSVVEKFSQQNIKTVKMGKFILNFANKM